MTLKEIKKKVSSSSSKSCANCGMAEELDNPLKCCTQCKLVFYCSKECQSAHWKQPQGHRKFCIKPNQRKPTVPKTSQEVEKEITTSSSSSSTPRICSICLETINSNCKTLDCSHTLHFDCFTSLKNSSSGKKVCPECRKPIKTDHVDDMYIDEFGRCYCMKHKLATCHVCCLDFGISNEMREVDAGLRQAPQRIDELSTTLVDVQNALEWFKHNPNVKELPGFGLEFHQKKLIETNLEISQLQNVTENEKKIALKKATEKSNDKKMETDTIAAAWFRENPGKTHFEFGGEETQRLFEEFAAPPDNSSNKMDNGIVDFHICDYCKKNSSKKLDSCSKCRRVAYCDRKCQKAAWSAHKQICLPFLSSEETTNQNSESSEPKKKASLTWAQLEAFGGNPAVDSILEVRILKDDNCMRQVAAARDREGVIKTIAVYTSKRKVDGLGLGKILKWKNPHFHWFSDGSSGARIEEHDLVNITVE